MAKSELQTLMECNEISWMNPILWTYFFSSTFARKDYVHKWIFHLWILNSQIIYLCFSLLKFISSRWKEAEVSFYMYLLSVFFIIFMWIHLNKYYTSSVKQKHWHCDWGSHIKLSFSFCCVFLPVVSWIL